MSTTADDIFLRRAIQLAGEARAAGADPFGAVLVRDGVILHQGRDRCVEVSDPTFHAELSVISEYCRSAGVFALDGCTIYCSAEPCPMCAGAIHWAQVSRVVFSISQAMLQAMSGGRPKPPAEPLVNMGRRRIAVIGPLLAEEGLAVFEGYTWTSKVERHRANTAPTPPPDEKPDALSAAQALVEGRFPECRAAFLAGSVIRGEATVTSDLDMVILTTTPEAPYRESLLWQGWPVELFVHSEESVRRFFAGDAERRRPSLPMMCAEGRILRDRDGLAGRIKAEAQALLEAGPPPLTPPEIERRRYAITDLIDDLAGSADHAETLFIAPALADEAADLLLAVNGRWAGQGKWTPRALRRFDPAQADRLQTALLAVYRTGRPDDLIAFADAALAAVGGRLFAGYRLSGSRSEDDASNQG